MSSHTRVRACNSVRISRRMATDLRTPSRPPPSFACTADTLPRTAHAYQSSGLGLKQNGSETHGAGYSSGREGWYGFGMEM
eukprot:3931888-Rhodomonas_salina.2